MMPTREYDRVLALARAVQVRQVMPLIGPLLDAWDELPNDLRGLLQEQAPTLCEYLYKIDDAMCADISDDLSSGA
jgi:hypothetical protein